MKYSEIRDSLNTGDIILFSGKGLISSLVRWATGSNKWSHIGMVLRVDSIDTVFCLESTTLNTARDINSGDKVSGVQLTSLSTRIKTFKGDIGIRQLEKPLSAAKKSILFDFYKEVRGVEYEKSKLDLISAKSSSKEDLSSIYCSELIGSCYQRINLLPPKPPSSYYYPHDFSKGQVVDDKLKNNKLGRVELIKR
jgi:hypothetical protein